MYVVWFVGKGFDKISEEDCLWDALCLRVFPEQLVRIRVPFLESGDEVSFPLLPLGDDRQLVFEDNDIPLDVLWLSGDVFGTDYTPCQSLIPVELCQG